MASLVLIFQFSVYHKFSEIQHFPRTDNPLRLSGLPIVSITHLTYFMTQILKHASIDHHAINRINSIQLIIAIGVDRECYFAAISHEEWPIWSNLDDSRDAHVTWNVCYVGTQMIMLMHLSNLQLIYLITYDYHPAHGFMGKVLDV